MCTNHKCTPQLAQLLESSVVHFLLKYLAGEAYFPMETYFL